MQPASASRSHRGTWIAVACIALLGLIHAATLLDHPAPFVDEAWLAARAQAFAHTGRAFGALDQGVMDNWEGHWTFFPWLPTALQALSVLVVGEPSLLAVRAVSLLAGLALLAAVFQLGRKLCSDAAGIGALLLVGLSPAFFYNAHLGRTDTLAAALGTWGVVLALDGPTRAAWRAGLSGFLIGLAFEVHPHGAIFAPVAIVALLTGSGWSGLRSRAFGALVLGGVAGGVLYLGLHVLRHPTTYFELQQLVFAPSHRPPIAKRDPAVWSQGFVDTAWLVSSSHGPLLYAIPFAMIALARRGDGALRVLALFVSAAAGVALLIGTKFVYYSLYVTPFVDLMLAVWLVPSLAGWSRARVGNKICVAAALLAVIASVCWSLARQHWSERGDFARVQSELARVVKPNQRVIASQTWWFGLADRPYVSWENLVYYRRAHPGASLASAFEGLGANVFIVDGQVAGFIAQNGARQGYMDALRIDADELGTFLRDRGELLTQFDGGSYGTINVFKLKRK